MYQRHFNYKLPNYRESGSYKMFTIGIKIKNRSISGWLSELLMQDTLNQTTLEIVDNETLG